MFSTQVNHIKSCYKKEPNSKLGSFLVSLKSVSLALLF